MIEQYLEKHGLKRDQLTSEEVETLQNWVKLVQKNELKLSDVREYLNSMISQLEKEIANYEIEESWIQMLFRGRRMKYIRARLYNYLMLRDFLTAPERAKKYIERQLESIENQGRIQ